MVVEKGEGIQFRIGWNLLRHDKMPQVSKPSMDSLGEMVHNFARSTNSSTKEPRPHFYLKDSYAINILVLLVTSVLTKM